MSKPTWNDLHQAPIADLKRIYKLDTKQMEHAVREHLQGANAQERSALYDKVYSDKQKTR